MAPAWVLDAAVCGMMTVGAPQVSLAGLLDLSAILISQGFRRSFDEHDSSKEAEHDLKKDIQSDATASTVSSASDGPHERGGPKNTETGSCTTAAGSGGPGTGGFE